MAHIQKVKRGNVFGLLLHDFRFEEDGVNHNFSDSSSHSKIDATRTSDNQYLFFDATGEIKWAGNKGDVATSLRRRVRDRITDVEENMSLNGRKVRKDAVEGVSFVVTLPQDWPSEVNDLHFFTAVHRYLAGVFGKENVPVVAIHRDETTPHLQAVVIPEHEGRLNARHYLTREFYQHFHEDLQNSIEQQTGIHCAVLLDQDSPERRILSFVPHDQLDEAKDLLNQAIREDAEGYGRRIRRRAERDAKKIRSSAEDDAKALLEQARNYLDEARRVKEDVETPRLPAVLRELAFDEDDSDEELTSKKSNDPMYYPF